ncbi:hypothetical protein SETIT_5G382500v2 [Setaria italica]|uniref:RING-CH-type domain-containing protein n=1 Tax=Setaria italica TaxID=4555 RepID=A0A368REY1_SETIT|nr:hypothetical protein SETIT_5G382500v2 [Setaria italica]RCV28141.1 hypothetical protein SETIT_5G382500v2 [Setaria italica]RCV28142.1 hypothetical protein SETIT_5G382500v2 [Setaria italica]
MVNDSEQSAITAAAAAAATTTVEPGVERGRASGSGRRLAEESSNEEERSQRFSDAEDRSWHSHSRQGSASTPASIGCDAGASAGGGGAAERPRKSCVSECSLDDVVDLEAGLAEITKASPDKAERNCRICHLGLDSAAAESGAGIVLGCSCKNDLSRAHKQCAETWFKIRGNRSAKSVAQLHATWQVSVIWTSSSSGMNQAAPRLPRQQPASPGGFGKGTGSSTSS